MFNSTQIVSAIARPPDPGKGIGAADCRELYPSQSTDVNAILEKKVIGSPNLTEVSPYLSRARWLLTGPPGRKYFPPMVRTGGNSRVILGSGFSLAEITVALALMMIVAAMAFPRWSKLIPNYQLDSSVRQVQSELHNLRMRAAAENIGFQLDYLDGASSYTIQKDSKALMTKPLPEGIVIIKAGTISFSPRGTAGANRVRLRHPEGFCKQVVVSATGRIRICQPNDCSGDC